MRRKEIVAASLVVLIGMAGYLNWSYRDTIQVRDNESYIETGKKLGEAQYVNSVSDDADAVSVAKESEVEEETEDALFESFRKKAEAETDEETGEAEDSTETSKRSSIADVDDNYFEQARIEREQARSKSIEILNSTAQNEALDEGTRSKAGEEIIAAAKNVECEQSIESIAQSKGYSEICAVVSGDSVNIMVRKKGFDEQDVAKLTEIATEQTKISSNNVKVVEVE